MASIQVSVPIMMSALVLSIRFLTGPCLDLMDWKFTTKSLSGSAHLRTKLKLFIDLCAH